MGPGEDATKSISWHKATKVVLLAVVGCAVLGAVAIPAWMLRGMMEVPRSTAAAGLRSATSGTQVDIVVEVTGSNAGAFSVRLLEATADGRYRRTATFLRILRSEATRFEMGAPSGVTSGALLSVRGLRAENAFVVRATRIVILTGYATVR